MSYNKTLFRTVNKNPAANVQECGLSQQTVNALAIALDISWKDAVNELIKQVHALCLMPSDRKVVHAMLKANGFVLQPGRKNPYSADYVCSEMTKHCNNGEIAIMTSRTTGYYGFSAAIKPDENGYYVCFTFKENLNTYAEDVWIRWQDGLDHSPVARRKARTAAKSTRKSNLKDNEYFHRVQQNPEGNNTGDCVVRGIASFMGISWHEAVDKLFDCCNYSNVIINSSNVYYQLMKKEGCIMYKQMKYKGRPLKASAFCEEMNKKYHNNERILAHIGTSHIAAIMPIKTGDITSYKVEDSWDSSGRNVGVYWVENKKLNINKQKEAEYVEYKIGQYIQHPVFGTGYVTDIKPSILEVNFSSKGTKMLSKKWVNEHCISMPDLQTASHTIQL